MYKKICCHCAAIFELHSDDDDHWLCPKCSQLSFAPEFIRRMKEYRTKCMLPEYSDDDLAHLFEWVFAAM